MSVPRLRYTVYYREAPNSPQWEDSFDKGSNNAKRAQAEKRAYEICLNGGLAVIVPSILVGPAVLDDNTE